MGAHRQVNLAAGALKLVGNLHARRTGADHQHRALGQLLRVVVMSGVDLPDAFILRRDRRDHRTLERAGGGHHAVGFDDAGGGFDRKAGPPGVAHHLPHLDAGADRRIKLLRIRLEISCHVVLAGEAVGVDVKCHAREAVVPGRAVGHQRVPAPGAPAFGNAIALQHQVRHAEFAQVLAHGDACLAGTHDQRVCFYYFRGHLYILPSKAVGFGPLLACPFGLRSD
ncbi:hypothetical protein D3C81_1033380 [compost metagenome]